MRLRWPFALRRTVDARDATIADLQEKYDRVQWGYDQGVLEGMRQAYVNVRADLADELFANPQLRILAPKLAAMGQDQQTALVKMKSLAYPIGGTKNA